MTWRTIEETVSLCVSEDMAACHENEGIKKEVISKEGSWVEPKFIKKK